MSDREELRKKLRCKINSKRHTGDDVVARMKSDPATTMLAMGLDDPHILKNAKSIVRNPHSFLKHATNTTTDAEQATDEEEEAPPPV